MVFTRIASLLAWFAFLLGIAMAYSGFTELQHPVYGNYLPSAMDRRTDLGLFLIATGVALGVLSEISRALKRGVV